MRLPPKKACMTIDDFLKTFPVFKDGDGDLVRKLVAAGRFQSIPEATQIYIEGDNCQGIAFVLSGEIRIYKIGETGREITLYEIGPGETCILNASCILSGSTYPANAIVASDASILLVPSADFHELVTTHEKMRVFVFSLLSRRLATVMELVEEVAFGRMDQRLLDYLIEKSEGGRLETTHQIIANDLGTSREVVSRLLKDFERKQQVRLSRNLITLLKP
jgi:CRP/FNR family transcriptional regulator